MILSVAWLPQLHGQVGWLDELELRLAPLVIVITLLVYRFLEPANSSSSGAHPATPARARRREEISRSAGSLRGRSFI